MSAREPLRVVAAVLVRADGRVLVAQRPPGKPMAGGWEFPGGKRGTGETAREALARELAEELGIEVARARPFWRVLHAYPERDVELDVWEVAAWSGAVQALEGQPLAWVAPAELPGIGLLPADRPLAVALAAGRELPLVRPSCLLRRRRQVLRALGDARAVALEARFAREARLVRTAARRLPERVELVFEVRRGRSRPIVARHGTAHRDRAGGLAFRGPGVPARAPADFRVAAGPRGARLSGGEPAVLGGGRRRIRALSRG